MVEGSIYYWVVPFGRAIAGFMAGLLLGIAGGWMAVVIYAMAGFPWTIEVQRNMYLVWIGLGAGIGSYLGWMNLTSRFVLRLGVKFHNDEPRKKAVLGKIGQGELQFMSTPYSSAVSAL